MHQATASADEVLDLAVNAVKAGAPLESALDPLPAAIYTTDPEGRVTFYNRACIDFAGRTPSLGEDRWCVTWRLYTEDGHYLPHDRCPMAVAVRERRVVRGVEAIAERPDGSRRRFRPYPTPIFDEAGEFRGAVNLLLDLSGRERAQELREQAARCRRLAKCVDDPRTIGALIALAAESEEEASRLQPLD